jgi:hypothetical protein
MLCLFTVMFSASFYGGSYVHVPLQDAKSTTEVQLKFRTKQSEALLLLAAGRTDYCLIRLESGRLKVSIIDCRICLTNGVMVLTHQDLALIFFCF